MLRRWSLVAIGIGAIIGAGVFVLTGVAAATQAGPAIVVSYVVAGFACAFSALAYAELAGCVGGCGSAFGYAYATLGEVPAWVIGWALMLEYGMAVSAVAVGWSGYFVNALAAASITLPQSLTHAPAAGGVVNLPALLIVVFLGTLLAIGVRSSAIVNAVIVVAKLLAIAVFVAVGLGHVDSANWQPFLPFGWSGVFHGAALIFFAYIGFDAVSTAAEEAVNPRRDLPFAIIASLVICTVVYIVVAGVLTGIAHYATLNVASPVSDALLRLGHPLAAGIVAGGAIAGLTSVMLVMLYGQSRILLAMSRDGLLPKVLGEVHVRTRTPVVAIVATTSITAFVAAFVPIQRIAELVNIGTLFAFVAVCVGVIVLRATQPALERGFRTPFSPTVPVLGALACAYLMLNLPGETWAYFGVWMMLGSIVYYTYGRRHSHLALTER